MHRVQRVVAGVVLGIGGALGAGSVRAAEAKPVDLLRLPSARVVSSSLPNGASVLGALTDGDPRTIVEVEASDAAPLEVVFHFGGADVAPEGVRVTLPEPAEGRVPAARVEILTSTASAHAGFRSARADPLAATGKPRLLGFLPVQARYVLVRLSPPAGARTVSVAEVEVLGYEGPPESRYAFAESPAKALDVLARLEKTSALHVTVSADEKAMFARAQATRLDAAGFAEAALLASGVLDPGKRAAYLARLDDLERQARAALEKDAAGAPKGDRLLRWLHRGPLAKGYVAGQTDLHTVLDTGTFNCVSSAVLFNCLALRLGIDARAIEVPTHAFSVVYEGTQHRDVETTTAEGYDPQRDPAVIARFEKATGFRYIRDVHRDQRREVEEAGLAAIVYYNHGVTLAREKRYHEALLAYFRAMSLDPQFASAVKGALGVLAKWGVELAEAGTPEPALEVIETGLALAPTDAALVNNRRWVWQRWAEREIDAGRPDAALAVLDRAALAVPDGGFPERKAWVFLKAAERHADASRWEEALAAAEPGLARLEGAAREEIVSWRANLYLRWFQHELRAKRFEAAAVALERGLAALPGQRGLVQNAGYLTQEWARSLAATGGPGAALDLLRALPKRFPGNEKVLEAAQNHVRRAATTAADAGRYEEALASLAAAEDLLPDPKARDQTSLYVYDRWAKARMKAGAWAEAADVYARARERHPQDRAIRQNLGFLAQEWAKQVAATDPSGAIEALRTLRTRFPDVDDVTQAAKRHVLRAVQERAKAEPEAALVDLEAWKDLLQKPREAEEATVAVYDGWARRLSKAGQWQEAVDVYARALERVPGSSHLRGNAVATWHQWAKTFSDAKRWDEAIAVYDRGLERLPGAGVLKQNRAWCETQKKKG